MTYSDIIHKLIGKVVPIGETNTDKQRLENLENMITVAESLLSEIEIVSSMSHRNEHSIVQAQHKAKEALTRFKDYIQ